MEYKVKDKTFEFIYDYKDNDQIRESFNCLSKKIFGLDFEQWYQDGYWQGGYIPYSLLYKNKVVANVSVNVIDFKILGEDRRYIQIGTVMTEPDYTNMGLSRFLMNVVLEEWKDRCDSIYLFANDSVVDFYPKFGFEKSTEYQYYKSTLEKSTMTTARKLNMETTSDRNLVLEKYKKSNPFSVLSMENSNGLIMFYATSFMRNNIYYIDDYDAIVIAEFDGQTMFCNDIFCTSHLTIDSTLAPIIKQDTRKIVFGFTPKDTNNCDVALLKEDNTTLFVLQNKENIFQSNKLMFPVLSHA